MKKNRFFLQKYILIGLFFSISILHSQEPNWTINSADYSLDASIVAVLKINNEFSTDTNDIVAVFDENDRIRGVAKVTFNTTLNKYLVFISIHSNSNGDILKFKVYDASEDETLQSTNATFKFTPNEVSGSADTPFEVIASTVLNINNYKKNNISFYPNPTKNNLFITAKENIKSIKIYNILGEKVIQLKTDDTKIELQTSILKKGVYLIKVKTTNSNNTQKIIKL